MLSYTILYNPVIFAHPTNFSRRTEWRHNHQYLNTSLFLALSISLCGQECTLAGLCQKDQMCLAESVCSAPRNSPVGLGSRLHSGSSAPITNIHRQFSFILVALLSTPHCSFEECTQFRKVSIRRTFYVLRREGQELEASKPWCHH